MEQAKKQKNKKTWKCLEGDEWKGTKLTRLHSGKKKSVEQLLTHLSGHISGEVAVRGEFEMTAVACSVVHNVYFSWLIREKDTTELLYEMKCHTIDIAI